LHSKPSKQELTRFDIYTNAEQPSILLEMPELDYAEYLMNYAQELGFSKSSGMGLMPIDWVDLNNWSQVTKTTLSNWEALVIVYISKSYVDQYYLSNEKIVPAPYQQIQIDKTVVSNKIANLFRSMIRANENSDHGTTE